MEASVLLNARGVTHLGILLSVEIKTFQHDATRYKRTDIRLRARNKRNPCSMYGETQGTLGTSEPENDGAESESDGAQHRSGPQGREKTVHTKQMQYRALEATVCQKHTEPHSREPT